MATPITYGIDTNYWQSNVGGQGLRIIDGAYEDIVPDDNAYGTDIEVQYMSISPDWDIAQAGY